MTLRIVMAVVIIQFQDKSNINDIYIEQLQIE